MRTCDILAPRLSARHKSYFCVKDAEKTCNYVILSVLGIFYKLFCTSMTTSIIIGFYYYISPGCYIERTQFIFRIQGKKSLIHFGGRWLKTQKMLEKDLKTWDVSCLEAVSYKVACFPCFACFSNLGFHFNIWRSLGRFLFFSWSTNQNNEN